jgi:hypothetical protein
VRFKMKKTPAERFADQHDRSGGLAACWPWTGRSKNRPGGYGRFSVDGVNVVASRFAWTQVHGQIADGLSVCHRCDNPGCVNPTHLFLAPHTENMRDRNAKGRQARLPNESNGNAKLTDAEVAEIRAAVKAGKTQTSQARRFCRSPSQINNIVHRRQRHLETE